MPPGLRCTGYGRKKFTGTVTAHDASARKYAFHIKYDDGDEEDITKAE